MKIVKVKLYKLPIMRANKGELRLAAVTFDNGLKISDITLKENFEGKLTIKFPYRKRKEPKTQGILNYPLIWVERETELYQLIESAIVDQWRRYSANWRMEQVSANENH